MICYVLAMGKQHLGPHVVVGYGIKMFWPGLLLRHQITWIILQLACISWLFWFVKANSLHTKTTCTFTTFTVSTCTFLVSHYWQLLSSTSIGERIVFLHCHWFPLIYRIISLKPLNKRSLTLKGLAILTLWEGIIFRRKKTKHFSRL